MDRVAVILVIFGGVDPALRRDRVCPSGAVLKAKSLDIISQFRKGSGSRCTSKTSPNNDYIIFSFIGRIDQFHIEFMFGPFFGYRSRRHFRFEVHILR